MTMPFLTRRAALAGVAGAALAHPALAQGAADTLRFIPSGSLSALDPVWTTAYVVRNHGYMVFDTLYASDSRFQVQPQMAAGHEVGDDSGPGQHLPRGGVILTEANDS